MLKISYAGCPGLSPAVLAQFTHWKMRISQKLRNTQRRSRSSMLILLKSPLVVSVVITRCLSAIIFTLDETKKQNNDFLTVTPDVRVRRPP